MGKAIVKLAENEYVEWSTVVDAPVTYIVDREEAVKEWGDERVSRADKEGHSFVDRYPFSFGGNHAGPNGTEITVDEIRKQYANPGDSR